MIEQTSPTFSSRRCLDLLVTELVIRARSALLTSAVLAALIVLFHLSADVMNENTSVLGAWMPPILFIWGSIEASKVFDDMHRRQTMPGFLLLPASALEKTVARYLLVTLVFAVFLCVFGAVVSLLCAFLSFAVLGQAISPPAIFDRDVGQLFRAFIITQSLFFLGGAWFKKSQLAKTAITLLTSFIALMVFVIALAKVLAPEAMFDESSTGIDFGAFITDHDDNYLMIARFTAVAFFIVVPAFSFYLSWLRVREVQLSDGI